MSNVVSNGKVTSNNNEVVNSNVLSNNDEVVDGNVLSNSKVVSNNDGVVNSNVLSNNHEVVSNNSNEVVDGNVLSNGKVVSNNSNVLDEDSKTINTGSVLTIRDLLDRSALDLAWVNSKAFDLVLAKNEFLYFQNELRNVLEENDFVLGSDFFLDVTGIMCNLACMVIDLSDENELNEILIDSMKLIKNWKENSCLNKKEKEE